MTQVVVLEPFETGSGLAVVDDTIDIDASLAFNMVTHRKARFVLADPLTVQRQDAQGGTWAQMQARAARDGEQWLLTDTVLRPEWWQYSAAAGRWYPVSGSSRLVNRVGSVTTPLASITGVTAATFFGLDAMAVPAGFLAVGSRVRIEALFRRSGSNGTANIRARLGTAGDTNDAILVTQQMAATNTQTYRMFALACVSSATSLLCARGNAVNGTTTDAVADITGQVDIAAAMQLTLGTANTNAGDTFACLAVAVDVDF